MRRAPTLPLFRLGGRDEPLVQARLGARFPAFPAKEGDFVLVLPARREK